MVAGRAAPSDRVNPGWFHDLVGVKREERRREIESEKERDPIG